MQSQQSPQSELIIKVVQPQKSTPPSWSLRGNPSNSDLLLKIIVNNMEELSVVIDSFAKHNLPLHNYASKISQCPINWQEGVWRRKLTVVLAPKMEHMIAPIPQPTVSQPTQYYAGVTLPPPPVVVPKWSNPPDDTMKQLMKLAEAQVASNPMSLPDFNIRVGKNQTKIFNYLRSSLAFPGLTMAQAMIIAEHLANFTK